ncbi:MAG: class I SAM-dependent rRNA methyltransferase [Gammaproteobacteria bacterium]|nr:class I SAM-dependent rRNA methyltransferase [Gammaproteobacteria bacterium]
MSTPKTLAPLRLKKKEERRLHTGHLWVFSNEVDVAHTPLTGFEPGQLVSIEASNGAVLGTGYANPHSLICARLVSRDPHYVLDQSLLVHRLNIALSLRERLFDKPYYRLVFGEGDALPGLVVDRYGDVLVVQLTTAGMERVKIEVVAALQKVIKPRAIVLRNDTSSRALEGLPKYVETVLGETPEWVRLEENGVVFDVPVLTGQKTGWFYDHRMNRARMQHYVKDRRVLDVFSYLGGWGVQAAAAGASEVLCVDSSQSALAQLRHNAALNGVTERVTGIQADAFDALKSLRAERQKFDVVILDPPAFIKRKKDLKQGLQAYHQLNQMAMQVLAKDGILISASCSYHLESNALQDVLLQTSRHVDRNLQILEQGQQGPDHPVHPAIPETRYLNAFFTRVYLG